MKARGIVLGVLILMFSETVCNNNAWAGEPPTSPAILGSNVETFPGETVKVDINLSDNPGITSLKLNLDYDEAALDLVSVNYNSAVIGSNVMQPRSLKSPVILNWFDGLKDVTTEDLTFATLTFAVSEDAAPASYNIALSYDPDDLYNITETNVNFATKNAVITVKEKTKAPAPTSIISNPFRDVSSKAYYKSSVLYLLEKGIMKGFSADRFGVGANLTREDMVTLVWRATGCPSVKVDRPPFADVSIGKYYTLPIYWAKTNGIVGGFNATTFGKGSSIIRQDFIKVLYGYAKSKGYNTSATRKLMYREKADASKVSSYAVNSMEWAYENGLIGVGSDLRPKETISRQDAAVILARFFKKYEK